jgi:thioredoxin
VIRDVTDETFEAEVLRSEVPVLVDFWAQWCPPCHRLAPVLDQLAVEYAGRARVVKVDVETSPRLVARYRVLAMPTLSVFRDGAVVSQTVGAPPASRLRDQIDRVVASAPL